MSDLISSTLRVLKHRQVRRLQVVIAGSIVGVVLLGASAFASDDSAFYFNESGKMQMNDTWSPLSPNSSRRTTEADRKNYNDWINSQTLKQNEAQTYQYYHSNPPAPPSHGSHSFWFTPGPGERSRLCQQVGAQVLCN